MHTETFNKFGYEGKFQESITLQDGRIEGFLVCLKWET